MVQKTTTTKKINRNTAFSLDTDVGVKRSFELFCDLIIYLTLRVSSGQI